MPVNCVIVKLSDWVEDLKSICDDKRELYYCRRRQDHKKSLRSLLSVKQRPVGGKILTCLILLKVQSKMQKSVMM